MDEKEENNDRPLFFSPSPSPFLEIFKGRNEVVAVSLLLLPFSLSLEKRRWESVSIPSLSFPSFSSLLSSSSPPRRRLVMSRRRACFLSSYPPHSFFR